MSLFHSVPPERHGILTNTYVPQVRPIKGLCERLSLAGKICSFFYNWEELRDLSRPSYLAYSYFVSGQSYPFEKTNEMVTENAISYMVYIKNKIPLICIGENFEPGSKFKSAGIYDIAPTITELIGVAAVEDWKGKSLIAEIE